MLDLTKRMVRWFLIAIPFLFFLTSFGWGQSNPRPVADVRVPAEFENQEAILLGANGIIEFHADVFVELVERIEGRIKMIVMVCDSTQSDVAKSMLKERGLSARNIQFLKMSHDTMWSRDYGPIVTVVNGKDSVFVDADYGPERTNDDSVPQSLAQHFGNAVVRLPLRVDGGNLLFNGAGIAVTTNQLWDENMQSVPGEPETQALLRRTYGLNHLVTLEPMFDEPTGHVDMFATFVSKDTIVVGQYDSEVDPVNAAILDRNAAILAGVPIGEGHLNVVRVPMPARNGDLWRTYTNVIFANGLLLVPVYPDIPQPSLAETIATYKRLLPEWRIDTIDASGLIESCGALHCVSMNLFHVGSRVEVSRPWLTYGPADLERQFEGHTKRVSPFKYLRRRYRVLTDSGRGAAIKSNQGDRGSRYMTLEIPARQSQVR